jgi:hypothetical protein
MMMRRSAMLMMEETGQKEVSLTDPDSRLIWVDSQKFDVCYNVES